MDGIITWQDGIGQMPGSDLKFRKNELGLVEILDDEAWKNFYDQTEGPACAALNKIEPETKGEPVLPNGNLISGTSDSSSSQADSVSVKESATSTCEGKPLLLSCTVTVGNGYEACNIVTATESTVLPQVSANIQLNQPSTADSTPSTVGEETQKIKTEEAETVADIKLEIKDESDTHNAESVDSAPLPKATEEIKKEDVSEVETQVIDSEQVLDSMRMMSCSAGKPVKEERNRDKQEAPGKVKRKSSYFLDEKGEEILMGDESSDEESLPDIGEINRYPPSPPRALLMAAQLAAVTKKSPPPPSPSKPQSPANKSPTGKAKSPVVNSPNKKQGNQKESPKKASPQKSPRDVKCEEKINSNTWDEMRDSDPGPPCLRPRSRSRSLSPAFHLAQPSRFQPANDGPANLEGIPILRAEHTTADPDQNGIGPKDSDIAFCKCCGCFGYATEFYERTFCTKACGDSYKYYSRSPEGKRRLTPATPNKFRTSPLGENGYYRNGDDNYNGLASGLSSHMDRTVGKKVRKKFNNGSTAKARARNAAGKGKGKMMGPQPGPSSQGKGKRLKKGAAFVSKDRKRNFSMGINKRVAGSPERKTCDTLTKEVQLSPDITLGKPKPSTSRASYVEPEFDWLNYLVDTKAKSANIRLFRNPAMPPGNPFRVGMMMEAIDPQHQSLICVATIMDIAGYRLKLRFQGFSDAYDFWVNADSLDIFPAGWCQDNGLELQPPPGENDPFNWHQYLVENQLEAAPRHLFAIAKEDMTQDSGVRPGMKLEAVDIRNQNLVCVATVAKVMGERILVHFDSWDSLYDYWTDMTSPFIHPVGWCDKNNVKLTPPNYCKTEFTWEKYIRDTSSIALPSRLFRPLPPFGFKKGTKIECVDRRNPNLIRVATIAEVDQHNLVVHFDNWPSIYDYSVHELSPDIHPVGWCAHTGHVLQPPPPADGTWNGPCTIVGCIGVGHIRGPKFLTHNSEKNCPYALHNYKKDWLLADRLVLYGPIHKDNSSNVEAAPKSFDVKPTIPVVPAQIKGNKSSCSNSPNTTLPMPTKSAPVRRKRSSASSTKEIPQQSKRRKTIADTPRTPTHPAVAATVHEKVVNILSEIKKTKKFDREIKPGRKLSEPVRVKKEESFSHLESAASNSICLQEKDSPGRSVTVTSPIPSTSAVQGSECSPDANSRRIPTATATTSTFPAATATTSENETEYPPNYATNAVSLKTAIGTLNEATVSSWRVEELAHFISGIPGCEHTANQFLDQLIDGESFLMLSQNDFINVMGLKLGPAIKLCNVIRMINFNSANYK